MEIIMPTKQPRWYRGVFRKRGVKLWQLCEIFNVPEPVMSRWLNGIRKIPRAVDEAMEALAVAMEAADILGVADLPPGIIGKAEVAAKLEEKSQPENGAEENK